MSNVDGVLSCPKCGAELGEAMRAQVAGQIEAKYKAEIERAQKLELDLRKEKNTLEEEKRKLELEVQRQIDAERNKIIEKIAAEKDEQFKLKQKEWEEKTAAMQKAIEEAQRKGAQGSQQLQGEVAELDLEQNLRETFPGDLVEGVPKGVLGADIRQRVKSPKGFDCGTILWEVKRTKAWSDGWVTKLKDDILADKASAGIIVSEVLPVGVSGIENLDGVWACTPVLAVSFGGAVRKGLLDAARERAISLNRSDKASELYTYITSQDFKNQVEMMVATYQEMKEQIERERAAYERLWKAREMAVGRLMSGVNGVVGSISGIVPLPSMINMELEPSVQ